MWDTACVHACTLNVLYVVKCLWVHGVRMQDTACVHVRTLNVLYVVKLLK